MTATHLLGIKFIPACEPMIGDVLCGVDYLYIGGFLVLVFSGIIMYYLIVSKLKGD